MMRPIHHASCFLVVLALITVASAADNSNRKKKRKKKNAKPVVTATEDSSGNKLAIEKPEAEKPEAKKPEAEKPEAEKPEAKKPEAEKPEAEKPEAKKPEAKKPATHEVGRELVKVDVSLSGVLEASSTSEIILRPKQWRTFKVLKAVAHGTKVKRGDVLVEFDSESFDDAISDRRTELKLAELSLRLAKESQKIMETTTPLDLAYARRSQEMYDEDTQRFWKQTLPLSKKSAEEFLKMYRNYLEYEKEELRQLEKMYLADDLTEETEEIVLKRQRDSVARLEFSLKMAEVRYEETMKVSIPRQEESMKRNTKRMALSTQLAETMLPVNLNQSRLGLQKMIVAHERAQKKFKELLADRKLMTIKAPHDGIVYYGKCVLGKWSSSSSSTGKLQPHGSVMADTVFMTIVRARPLFLRSSVEEKNLHWIRRGMKGTVESTGYPDLRLPASLVRVDAIPSASSKYEVIACVNLPKEADALMPGMTCKIKLVPYLKKEALTVPSAAVATDQLDDQKKHVFKVDKDGNSTKQPVTVGQKMGDNIEILKGLRKGDLILKEIPKEIPKGK